jgi:hypothetical protein
MSVYRGCVDELSERLIRGWCDPPGHPSVYVNGKLVGIANLMGSREDASPTAIGFFFQPSRFLAPGPNNIRVSFPDGTVPQAGEMTIVYSGDLSP